MTALRIPLVFLLSLSVGAGTLRAGEADPSTLDGKVMCGYQGWFNCEGDGAKLGWSHWGRGGRREFSPENVSVDLWPDMEEYGEGERFETGFKLADGSVAEVFSSFNRDTVMRHFRWMRDYGIDGAFIQRFANGLDDGRLQSHKDAVLSYARAGAEKAGRTYAVMYDLSGLRKAEMKRVIEDWTRLRRHEKLTDERFYQKHEEKPLVAVWGIGFSDDRAYTLRECHELVQFFKNDGCAVMLGVPSWWREGKRDALADPELQQIIRLADVVSPWTVGRYRTPGEAAAHAEKNWKPDLEWCGEKGIDFLPVVFPGFSWANLTGPDEKLGSIPRLKGEFLWSQFVAAKRAGCGMVYVAMFDEVDEGTAIFKCTNAAPVGEGVRFLDYEGLPSDYYLRLTGAGGKLIRGEISAVGSVPIK